MNIGEKLKLLRENNNMTRKEVADRLKNYNIDISDKTLYGYESGRNSANADMFLALCQIYKCNNIMETFSNTVEDVLFTNKEWTIIERYRKLNPHVKEVVDFVLDKEYENSITATELKEAKIYSLPSQQSNDHSEVLAAHERTDVEVTDEMRKHDQDIMMNDSEWE